MERQVVPSMFVFKSYGHEAEYRYWHAQQLQQYDGVVMLVNWPTCLVGLKTIFRFRRFISPVWLAVITAVFIAERVRSFTASMLSYRHRNKLEQALNAFLHHHRQSPRGYS